MSYLEVQTQKYWNISLQWNGRPTKVRGVSTGDAINTLSGVLYNMNPSRKLANKVADLLDDVVHGYSARNARKRGA